MILLLHTQCATVGVCFGHIYATIGLCQGHMYATHRTMP